MKFVCLGYADHNQFRSMSEEEMQRAWSECFAYDDVLRSKGNFSGGEALEDANQAVTLRYRDGKVQVTDGPFAETKEQIGGILFLEADNMDQAVELMSDHPGVRLGPFEIRPADAQTNAMIDERDRQFQQQRTDNSATQNADLNQQKELAHTACPDERAILDMMTRWRSALQRKDVATLVEDYLPDAMLFDACPPYKTIGSDGIQKTWEACLPYFPDTFQAEHRDLEVVVGENVAFVHGVFHFVPEPADHPCGQTWMRVSLGLRRVNGNWKVAHEHVSIPFDPITNHAHHIKDPDEFGTPDGSAGSTEGSVSP